MQKMYLSKALSSRTVLKKAIQKQVVFFSVQQQASAVDTNHTYTGCTATRKYILCLYWNKLSPSSRNQQIHNFQILYNEMFTPQQYYI